MEHTSNYELSKWAESDRIMMEDFNMDHDKIDAALAGAGNCKIATGSYVGTGKYGSTNPTRLDFSDTLGTAPRFLYITDSSGTYYMFLIYGVAGQYPFLSSLNSDTYNQITWTATGLSWYNTSANHFQLNSANLTYRYVAFA